MLANLRSRHVRLPLPGVPDQTELGSDQRFRRHLESRDRSSKVIDIESYDRSFHLPGRSHQSTGPPGRRRLLYRYGRDDGIYGESYDRQTTQYGGNSNGKNRLIDNRKTAVEIKLSETDATQMSTPQSQAAAAAAGSSPLIDGEMLQSAERRRQRRRATIKLSELELNGNEVVNSQKPPSEDSIGSSFIYAKRISDDDFVDDDGEAPNLFTIRLQSKVTADSDNEHANVLSNDDSPTISTASSSSSSLSSSSSSSSFQPGNHSHNYYKDYSYAGHLLLIAHVFHYISIGILALFVIQVRNFN